MKQFWKDALERVVRTAAQAFIASFGATGVALHEVDWFVVGSTVAGAVILSFAMSLVSFRFGETGTASALKDYSYGEEEGNKLGFIHNDDESED